MNYIELLLEDLSEQKKAYDGLEICPWSSEDDKIHKRIMAESIIRTQSMIIEELMEDK